MQDVDVITPLELSSEHRWWSAMGFPQGAPQLIEQHGLHRRFQETYRQEPVVYFRENPALAYDPTLFDELTNGLKDRPHALPILGPPVSGNLRQTAAALWRQLGVPGPIEFFVQHDLYDDLRQALGGWEPQAVIEVFPEHADGVVLSSIIWWHHALAAAPSSCETTKAALGAISPLVRQYEIEAAQEADMVRSGLS